MKVKKKGLLILFMLLIFWPMKTSEGAGEDNNVLFIFASYHGKPVVIGEKIAKEDIEVTAVFDNATIETVDDFDLLTETVSQTGVNNVQIQYLGKMCTIQVEGKAVTGLYAYHHGGAVSVGNRVSRDNLSVYAFYSDGTNGRIENYSLFNDVIVQEGVQNVYVIYSSYVYRMEVECVKAKPLQWLEVRYAGFNVIQGNPVPESALYVYANYTDGTRERIYNYTISPEIIKDLGTNRVEVSYRDKVSAFTVECVPKTLVSISARYLGDKMLVGKDVDPDDMEVKAHYNDNSSEIITGFKLVNSKIRLLGDNKVTVTYGDLQTLVVIQGVSELPVSYANEVVFEAVNGKRKTQVHVALPRKLPVNTLTGATVKQSKVSRVLRKLDEKVLHCISFEIKLQDETQDDIFPLTLKLSIPNTYVPEQTFLYYTPNRKSVIAQLNTEWIGERELEVTIFHAGTYILAYQEAPEVVLDEEDE